MLIKEGILQAAYFFLSLKMNVSSQSEGRSENAKRGIISNVYK